MHRDRGPREDQHGRTPPGDRGGPGLPCQGSGSDRPPRRGPGGARRRCGRRRCRPRLRRPQLDGLGPGDSSSAPAGIRSAAVRDPQGLADITDEPSGGIGGALNYAWQFYLPPSPVHRFAVRLLPTARDLVQRLHRHLRLARVRFRTWVYDLALGIVLAIVALAGRELIVHRGEGPRPAARADRLRDPDGRFADPGQRQRLRRAHRWRGRL